MRDRSVLLIGLLALGGIAVLRAAVLYSPGAPAGIDGGNWLAFGSFVRPGMVYPPLIPAIFAALVGLFGAPAATVIAGALTTAAPALAVFAVLAWAGHGRSGVIAGLAIAASRAIGEVAAWGGYPQPTALAAGIVSIVALAAWLIDGSRWSLAAFAIAFAVVAATSHLVAVPVTGACVLLLVGALAAYRRRSVPPVTASILVMAVPYVLLAPTYVAIVSTLGGPGLAQVGDAERVLGPGWPVYLAALVAVPAGLVIARRRHWGVDGLARRDRAVISAAVAAAVTWIAAYLVTGEPRLLHDMGVLAIFVIAALVPVIEPEIRDRRVRAGLAVGAVVVAAAVVALGLSVFKDQVAYYRILTSDRFAAIEWLAENAPDAPQTILVGDVNGVSTGWWVEGMVRQEVLFASDLRWLRFTSERARAKTGNELLYRSGFPSAESARKLHDAGVQLVFLPSAGMFGIHPTDPPPGWRVVFSSGDAVVLTPDP